MNRARVYRLALVVIATALLGLPVTVRAGDPYTVEDIVLASQSGMPPSILARMATSRTDWALDSELVAKMLRSGVPAYVVSSMTAGVHPTEAEVSAAALSGDVFAPRSRAPTRTSEGEDESLSLGYEVIGPSYFQGHMYMTAVT